MEKINFLEQTQKMFRNRPAYLTLSQISIETGLKTAWLGNFATCENGSVKHINLLHNYLIDKINEAKESSLN